VFEPGAKLIDRQIDVFAYSCGFQANPNASDDAITVAAHALAAAREDFVKETTALRQGQRQGQPIRISPTSKGIQAPNNTENDAIRVQVCIYIISLVLILLHVEH